MNTSIYRHLNQLQETHDGNFQLNHMKKNCDPNDISLLDGRGYFPRNAEYQAYLKTIPYSKEVGSFP
jgi:hypothetical protein